GMAVNPLSKKTEIPILGAVAHPDFIKQNPYAYQFWPSPNDEAGKIAKVIFQNGVKSIYSLSTEDDWLLAFQKGLEENYQQLGGKITVQQNVEPTFLDFRSLILKIKQSGAEGVFIGLAPNQLGIFIKQFREAGMTQTIYTTFMIKFEDVLNTLNQDLLDQIVFVEIDAMKPNFVREYQKIAQNRPPAGLSYSCYLTSEALYQACEKHLENKQTFSEILSKMTTVETTDQPIKFKNQKAEFDLVVNEFQQGRIVQLIAP
ncbi:MAG: ABC transporter substrate-binding protein, partial [Candidatus Paceibacterota bacterium]